MSFRQRRTSATCRHRPIARERVWVPLAALALRVQRRIVGCSHRPVFQEGFALVKRAKGGRVIAALRVRKISGLSFGRPGLA